jgi:hypothetical protein
MYVILSSSAFLYEDDSRRNITQQKQIYLSCNKGKLTDLLNHFRLIRLVLHNDENNCRLRSRLRVFKFAEQSTHDTHYDGNHHFTLSNCFLINDNFQFAMK